MLASSSSFLVNATPAPPGAPGGGDAPGKAAAAPGFAALLDRLSALAEGDEAGDAATPPGAHAAVATAFARGLAFAVGLHRPAIAGHAANGSGKDLPDGLPDLAEAGGEAEAAAAADPAGADATALPILPDGLLAVTGTPAPLQEPSEAAPVDRPALPASPKPQGPAAQALAAEARAAAATAKSEPQVAGKRAVPAVSVSVAAQVAPTRFEPAASEPATPASARTAPAADLAGSNAVPAQPSPAAPAIADPRQPVPPAGLAPATGTQAPGPSSADITAALDRLVAAREALMPAEAALAIDHAEFGEVSIRFEHKADGRLSAELAGADPELHRAVTAAVAAERSSAAGSDGDPGRPPQLASQRGSTGGSDAASGDRNQHGSDRDGPQRRGAGRPETPRPPSDQRPGIFA